MARDPVEFMQRMLESYDEVHTKRYWNEITPHIRELAGGRVLDIGCGPGLLLKDIIQRFDPQKAFGIDLSDVMLDKAREIHKKDIESGRLKLIQQHLQEDTTLPDHLDLVLSSRVMRSFENLYEVMVQVNRSLTDGGKFVLLDWAQASLRLYEQYLSESRENELTAEKIIAYHRNFSRYSLDDWYYIFSSTGFDVIHGFALSEVLNCIIGEKRGISED